MPAKVSENILLIDAAGFANDVEDVNQYADPIYAATDEAIFLEDEIKIIISIQMLQKFRLQKYLLQIFD